MRYHWLLMAVHELANISRATNALMKSSIHIYILNVLCKTIHIYILNVLCKTIHIYILNVLCNLMNTSQV